MGAATASNTWIINSSYTGGSGTIICLGFPFAFTVLNTAAQPAGITNAPASTYMHIAAQEAISQSITCASYLPSDGICNFDETNFSQMSAPISTVGFTGVSHDFWWMCAGSPTAYGEVYYSLDTGMTWVLKQSTLNNVASWTQLSLTDAAWDNQPSLMFGYRFVNLNAATASDPPFCIDDIVVSGNAATNTITTGTNLVPTSWCEGQTITLQVDFTSTGTFNPGNIYTAELSDASGSFASPTAIGTLASTSNSGMIIAMVLGSTPAGSGYRIRVVSSNPATVGSNNGTDLVINPLPTVTLQPFADVCINGGSITLTGESPMGGAYSGTGVSGGDFNPVTAGLGSTDITYIYTDGNLCVNSAIEPILVVDAPTVTFGALADACTIDAPFTLTQGSPAGGTYSGPGVVAGDFEPGTAGQGTHTLSYDYTDANGCSGTAISTIFVDICGSVNELDATLFTVHPNPATDHLYITSTLVIDQVKVLDMSGRSIRNFNEQQSVYSTQGIPSGVYLIVVHADGVVSLQRLIIE